MKIFSTSTFLLLFLGDFTRSNFVEINDWTHWFREKGIARLGRNSIFSLIRLFHQENRKSFQMRVKLKIRSLPRNQQKLGKTLMWGR